MDKEKKDETPFNADFIMNQMKEGVRNDGMRLPVEELSAEGLEARPFARAKSKKRSAEESGYMDIFFRNPQGNARNGKSVYISPEFHERLSRIVNVIGEDKLTIYAYLNNVLDQHFQEFGEDITKSFNEKYKPIL